MIKNYKCERNRLSFLHCCVELCRQCQGSKQGMKPPLLWSISIQPASCRANHTEKKARTTNRNQHIDFTNLPGQLEAPGKGRNWSSALWWEACPFGWEPEEHHVTKMSKPKKLSSVGWARHLVGWTSVVLGIGLAVLTHVHVFIEQRLNKELNGLVHAVSRCHFFIKAAHGRSPWLEGTTVRATQWRAPSAESPVPAPVFLFDHNWTYLVRYW